jgi:hypothetical protein
MGMATFIHPIRSDDSFANNRYIKNEKKQQASLVRKTIDILHGELLFKF